MAKDFNSVEYLRKTIFNYELFIEGIHNELTQVQSNITRYKYSSTNFGKKVYQNSYKREKQLLLSLNNLREGEQRCQEKIKEILTFYPNKDYRTIWYSHFILKQTDIEIAEKVKYETEYVRKIINKMRKDLIDLNF